MSQRFCDLLLSDPATALRTGYNGTGSFHLAPEDWEQVVSIRATSLADFAAQLTNNGHSRSSHRIEEEAGDLTIEIRCVELAAVDPGQRDYGASRQHWIK